MLHNLVSATDPEGGVTSYTYDIRSNRTAVTNALGDTFAYAYDRADRLTAVTDPEQKTASVVYDREGNIESITMPGGRTTRYGYDGNYNVKTVMDPKGYEYAYTYDRDDRLTGILDPLGQTVGYTYDRAGRLVASQDKLGRRESYLYDAQGSLLSHTWGEGLTVAYAYDRKGRPVSLTDPMGNTALYGWDVMDNLTSVTDYLGRTTAYTYDLEDNLTSVTGPMGRKETLSYDMASRLAAYTTNGGNTVTYDYDKLDSLTEKAYADAAGKESAAQVDYTYDALGRRTAMEDSTGDTLYTYDALGRLTAVTLCRRPGKSADAAFSREPDQCDTVGYLYDGADRLAAVTYPDGTRVSYEYDLNDNLIRVVGRRGEETVYEYDALNRPVAEHRPDGISTYKSYSAEDQVLTLTNRCDACGWVLGHYSYEYDAAGRLTAEHTQEARECDPYGRQPHDLYAPEQTNPGCSHGKDSTLSYRLLTTDRAYTYDGAGKLLEVTETEGTCGTTSWRYTCDAMGNLTLEEKKNPVGKVVESNRYRYNEDNQLTEAFLCDGRSSRKVVYTYDEDGNLIGEASSADNSLTTYRYTVEARLEAVYTGTAYNRNLLMAAAYDGDGNRVYQLNYNSEPDEDFSDYYCSYNPCDYNGTGIRLRAAGEVSPAEEALIALVGASGAVTDSRYELMEYINDVNREYAEVLVEQNINGRIDTVYTYGRERLGREMFGQEGRTAYYLYDPRGSVSGLTDWEGRLRQTYRYTASGELSYGGARYENEYTYNGESYNPNVECQYLRARYYSVARGSFLTQDSYLGELWQPLTWNRYNYCVSSWPNYRDPSGHSPLNYLDKVFSIIRKFLEGDPNRPKALPLDPKPITETVIPEILVPTPTPNVQGGNKAEEYIKDIVESAVGSSEIEYVDGEDILKSEIGFTESTKELIIELEGNPFLVPRINTDGSFTIGYGYDFREEEDPYMFSKYFQRDERGNAVVIANMTLKEAEDTIQKVADKKKITQGLDSFIEGVGNGNEIAPLIFNQNQYDALFSYFYSNGPNVFTEKKYNEWVSRGDEYAKRAEARILLRDYLIYYNGNYDRENIISLFINSKGANIRYELK